MVTGDLFGAPNVKLRASDPPPFLHPPRITMIFKLDFMHTTIQQHYDERGGRERGDWADGSRHRYTLYLLLLFERI